MIDEEEGGEDGEERGRSPVVASRALREEGARASDRGEVATTVATAGNCARSGLPAKEEGLGGGVPFSAAGQPGTTRSSSSGSSTKVAETAAWS